MSDELLDDTAIAAADLADWRRIGNALHTRFRTGDFATGLRLSTRSVRRPRRPTTTPIWICATRT